MAETQTLYQQKVAKWEGIDTQEKIRLRALLKHAMQEGCFVADKAFYMAVPEKIHRRTAENILIDLLHLGGWPRVHTIEFEDSLFPLATKIFAYCE